MDIPSWWPSKKPYIIGDCLEGMKKIPDKSVDLILTDPPYGIGETNEKNQSREKLAKCTDFGHYDWDKTRISGEVFKEMFRISKNQIIFGGNYYTDYLPPSSFWIVWDKDNGENDFADCELAWGSERRAVRRFKYRWAGMLQENMRKKEDRVHPTQKPIALFEWILERFSTTDAIILDPFLGSGTTLIAGRKTNRMVLGFEINPNYEAIIRKRYMANVPNIEGFGVDV